MYKHLLIPTDGSELSSRAVENGVSFARHLGAKVTFLYVQPEYPLPIASEGAMFIPEDRDEFAKGTQEQAERILSAASEVARRSGVDAASCTEVSDTPWQVVVNTVPRLGCDLVFMASHGRKGLAGLLIGSETHKVLTHCTTPVLIYR